ncbi:hypothetical protein [Streptomyces sp. NPDC051546]|uniref:hypothetical protein n=1 Tax=Streptomyces sp. NPDC051546 TaxID=3365655 RepID=UPI0037B13D0C
MTNTTNTTLIALPQLVRLTDPGVRERLEALPASTALIGIGADGQALAIDLEAEGHILVCTATGGGSTTLLRTLTAQFLHQGDHALVLDPTRISHLWATDLPTVTHRGNIAGIHEALLGLATELRRRLDLNGDLDGVPNLTVLLEQGDATVRQLNSYWEKFRQSSDPKTSPAIAALNDVLYFGRAAHIHVFFHTQANARVLGPGARDFFTTKILGRVSAATWQTIAPEVSPAPKSSKHSGRAHVVRNCTVQETQILTLTDAEARDLAATNTDTLGEPEAI